MKRGEQLAQSIMLTHFFCHNMTIIPKYTTIREKKEALHSLHNIIPFFSKPKANFISFMRFVFLVLDLVLDFRNHSQLESSITLAFFLPKPVTTGEMKLGLPMSDLLCKTGLRTQQGRVYWEMVFASSMVKKPMVCTRA